MQQRLIKVVVVDDSALMRLMISRHLEETGKFKVLATAINGEDGVNKICRLKPDAVTMDVEMPRMDGLTALKQVMRRCPVPVIMLSTLTTTGARITMQALSSGAVDFVAKPTKPTQLAAVVNELVEKITVAVQSSAIRKIRRAPVMPASSLRPPAPARTISTSGQIELVVIGSSTGGPGALHKLLPALPKNFPAAVVVVQHLPRGFSQPMAEHLNRKCQLEVQHARHNDPVQPGKVLVAPAGFDLDFCQQAGRITVKLDEGLNRPQKPGEFRPSVDWVMNSASNIYGSRAMGVLLTGMGKDGAAGMKALKETGSYTIAESETTCIVYGMPKAAIQLNAATTILPLDQIAAEIMRRV